MSFELNNSNQLTIRDGKKIPLLRRPVVPGQVQVFAPADIRFPQSRIKEDIAAQLDKAVEMLSTGYLRPRSSVAPPGLTSLFLRLILPSQPEVPNRLAYASIEINSGLQFRSVRLRFENCARAEPPA